jgi:hypothetical protein
MEDKLAMADDSKTVSAVQDTQDTTCGPDSDDINYDAVPDTKIGGECQELKERAVSESTDEVLEGGYLVDTLTYRDRFNDPGIMSDLLELSGLANEFDHSDHSGHSDELP